MEQPGATEPLIVSCGGWLPPGNRGQHGIENGFSIFQLHEYRDYADRLQSWQTWAQIHCVLLRGNKCRCPGLLAQALQIAHIGVCVTVVIAKTARASERDLCRLQLCEEVLWPGDAAEREARIQGFRRDDVTAHLPDKLVLEPQFIGRCVVREHD